MKNSGAVLCCIALAILVSMIVAWQIIGSKLEERRAEMLDLMYLRSESLAWAIEGGARATGRGDGRNSLSPLLVELSRQPGIAWLALVNREGKIIADSNPELVGQLLYSPAEIAALDASTELHSRFSPDDPQVFETWKSFSPWRLGHRKHGDHRGEEIVFVALDASSFRADLDDYADQLRLFAFLLIAFFILLGVVGFYAVNYSFSRKSLKDAKVLVRQIIDNYPEAMLVCDADGEIVLHNRACESLISPRIGQFSQIRSLPGFPGREILENVGPGRPMRDGEFELVKGDGEGIPVSISAALIAHDNGGAMGYLVTCRDLRQIRQLQAKLEESRRLSAMGQLAAGVAHEIRNPLGAICGYATYLKDKLAGDEMGQAAAELLEEEARRLDSALSDLLHLARRPTLAYEDIDVEGLLQRVAAVALPDAGQKNIVIEIAPVENASPLRADANRLLQALLNLVLNAIQAADRGGRIVLSASGSEEADGPWEICVEDDGPGIPPDILSRIFTPYFTTRADGTGLGLSLVQQIVEAHGGSVNVKSAAGKGTTFCLILPGGAEHG